MSDHDMAANGATTESSEDLDVERSNASESSDRWYTVNSVTEFGVIMYVHNLGGYCCAKRDLLVLKNRAQFLSK
jgi:hypothetical protein